MKRKMNTSNVGQIRMYFRLIKTLREDIKKGNNIKKNYDLIFNFHHQCTGYIECLFDVNVIDYNTKKKMKNVLDNIVFDGAAYKAS